MTCHARRMRSPSVRSVRDAGLEPVIRKTHGENRDASGTPETDRYTDGWSAGSPPRRRDRGPRRDVDDLEITVAEWIEWCNFQRPGA